MKAARFFAAGDIRIEDVPEPVGPGPDEVLVEVDLCGICGTDLHEYVAGPIVTPAQAHPLTGATLPQILGHEFSGRVRAVGREVDGVGEGQRVAVMPLIYCGRCVYCRSGRGHLCVRMAATGLSAAGGGLASYVVVKDYQVAVVPESMSSRAASLVEPAAVAAYGVDRVGVNGGDVVLVTGCGPVGALSALYAHLRGASVVVIAEPNANRARHAEHLGVGPVLDPAAPDFADTLLDLTDGFGVDVAVECSGTAAGLGSALDSLRASGRVVQTGLHTKPASFDAMRLSERDLSIVGSWCFPVTDWPRVIRMIASGRYDVERIVSSVISLDNVVTAGFDRLVDPVSSDLKILVSPA
jgi:(R,R)-butanediol dehydrogenase/meso-butanediol dehydrogenase/diacetyl reductase